jgi:hypothetical protein
MVVTNFGIGTASPMIEILFGIFGSFGADGIGGKERFDKVEKSGIWGIVGNCGVTLPCLAFCIPELIVPDRLLEVLGANPLIAGKLLEILAGIAFMSGRFFKTLPGNACASDDSFTPAGNAGNAFSVKIRAEAKMLTKASELLSTATAIPDKLFMVIFKRNVLVWKINV